MAQLTFLFHDDDPPTSAAAIEAIDASGVRQNHGQRVLRAVREQPGSTACELMEATGLTEYQIRRRLTDLKNTGQVIRGAARLCRVKGTPHVTWVTP